MARKRPRVIDGEEHWRCAGCGRYLPAGVFGRDRSKGNGLRSRCGPCERRQARKRRRRPEVRARRRKQAREYYLANAEREKARCARWRREHAEQYRETVRRRHRRRLTDEERARAREEARAYYQRHRERCLRKGREYRKRNAERYRVANLVRRAVRRGELVKPERCEYCRRPHDRLWAYHEDYEEPLEVDWLCPSCHSIACRDRDGR